MKIVWNSILQLSPYFIPKSVINVNLLSKYKVFGAIQPNSDENTIKSRRTDRPWIDNGQSFCHAGILLSFVRYIVVKSVNWFLQMLILLVSLFRRNLWRPRSKLSMYSRLHMHSFMSYRSLSCGYSQILVRVVFALYSLHWSYVYVHLQ